LHGLFLFGQTGVGHREEVSGPKAQRAERR
jgi:hypothetical protein